MSHDFSCIPCAGKRCFPLPVAERKACSENTHQCPLRVTHKGDDRWECRCCPGCSAQCLSEAW
jgi:hypothetical protein